MHTDQHSCRVLYPACSNVIPSEVKVHKRSALHQNSSCKPLFMWSGPIIAHLRSSSVVVRHRAFMNVSCLKTKWCFSFSVPLRSSSQKLLLKRTTTGSPTLSTTSLTLFDVLLSMIVLSASQVLLQSSGGRAPRAAAKQSEANSNAGCVLGT